MGQWQRVLIALFVVLWSSAAPAGSAAPEGKPAQAAAPGGSKAESAAVGKAGPVNINTADVKELMTLSGVGRRVAERIVQYRETNGPFTKPEEVRRVQGIGAGLWERNRNRIVVK